MDGRARQPPRSAEPHDASHAPHRPLDMAALTRAAQGGPVDVASVLALQRAAGNRIVARRSVTVYLGSPPPKRPQAPPVSAVKLATPENLVLAKEIDLVEQLSDDALLDRRTAVSLKAAGPASDEQRAAAITLKAIEFVADRRGLAPARPDYGRGSWGRKDIRRVNVRAETERGVRETGSFKRGINSFTHTTEVEGDIAALEAEAEGFGKDFTAQARSTAIKMLRGSLAAMDDVLESYGIPTEAARFAGARIANGADEELEAAQMLKRTKEAPGVDADKPVRHRHRLAQWAQRLKQQQQRVNDLDDRMGKLGVKVPYGGKGPGWDEMKRLTEERQQAHDELAATWIQAERLHPVLAAYRGGGKPLEQLGLKALDSGSVDDEMKEVLVRVLPKIGNSEKAISMIESTALDPLTLPSVVGLTSVTMFVPPGSIRAGVVQDLVEEARGKREHLWLDIAAFALAAITLIPSAGASIAIPAGMLSVSLAAFSAAETYDRNQRQKTLVDTDLDRARALSDEEPSMSSFAWSLVSLGLEGFALVHAFRAAAKIRKMVAAGESVNNAVNDLNRFGRSKGLKDLGKQAAEDAERGLGKEARYTPTAEPPEPPPKAPGEPPKKPPEEPPKKPPEEPPKKPPEERPRKTPEERPKEPGRPAPTGPASVKAAKLGFSGKADVRSKLLEALAGRVKSGMDAASLPKDYLVMMEKLDAAGPELAELKRLTSVSMAGIRDEKAWADLFAEAYERGVAYDTGFNAGLLKIASDEGLTVKVIKGSPGDLNGPVFFDRYAGKPITVLDKPFASPDPHSSMIHLCQDILANRALKRAGSSSAHWRSLLGKAETKIRFPGAVARGEPRMIKWGDYIWRTTYDGTSSGQMNTPEVLAPILQKLFKLK